MLLILEGLNKMENFKINKGIKTDSLTIGASATGGQIKIYFDMDKDSYEEIAGKCDKALKLWKAITTLSGKSR